jgi:hypothetical protein
MAGGGIDGAGTVFESLPEAAESAVARLMAKPIIDFFQTVEIEQNEREFAGGTLGAANLRMQDFEEAAIVGQTGQRIAASLVAELVFESALFGDIHDEDFEAGKIPLFVEGGAAAESCFEGRAVLALPVRLKGWNGQRVGRVPGNGEGAMNFRNDNAEFIRREKMVSGSIAQHGDEGHIDVEEFPFRVGAIDAISRVVDQSAIEGLRVL